MKIVLFDNLVMPEQNSLADLDVHPHLGLLALAAAAESAGHTVRIYDPKRAIKWRQLAYDSSLYERAAADVLASGPDAVGFTTLGCSFIFALGVATILKRHQPDLPILLGGPHATMLHRQILERFRAFDIIVRHEADETFPAVLDRIERRNFEPVPGISWRVSADRSGLRFTDGKPKVDDLDSLPIVSYDHYPVARLGLELLRIEAGRGCPFNCTFCSTASFFQRSFRLKSAGRLVRELDLLHARYGCSDFKLDHDMFTVNRRKVVEFCEAVKGRGYRWRASARVDGVDEDLLSTMAEAGCVGLYFGIETGSERMQRICQKRLDLNLVRPILDAAAHLGIATTASFITGYPEETERDQDDTLDMLGRCFSPTCLTQLHLLAPEPGTPMFDARSGTLAYDGYGGPYNAQLVDDGDRQRVVDHPDIFSTYYFYPAELPRFRYLFAAQAVDLLRRAGPIVLHYVLRVYGGQLSACVRELRHFAESHCPGQLPDAGVLEAYVTAKFGPRHHVTSLVRYALRAQVKDTEHRSERRPERRPFDLHERYRLSRDVHVLADLHDCGALIERIRRVPAESPLLDDDETGERGVFLLKNTGSGTMTYRIDPGVEAILALFEQPRSCREVTDIVCAAAQVPELPSRFFEDLARAEIIVPNTALAIPQNQSLEAARLEAATA